MVIKMHKSDIPNTDAMATGGMVIVGVLVVVVVACVVALIWGV